jgi:RHS repeat-associated protein
MGQAPGMIMTINVLSSYEYTLNKAGMRTAVVEKDSSRVEYVYDDLYKLVSETRTGIHAYTISYVYDYVGNRLQQTKNGIATTYLYNNRDQLVSEHVGVNSTTYSYDQSGRMVTKVDNTGTTRYTWIDEDRLTSVQSPQGFTTYEYDFNNNRISVVTDTVAKKYLIDMTLPYGQIVAEYGINRSLKCSYVYGLERISQSRNDTVHYYVADGQGSIRALTDVNGNVTDTYYYTAFGEELAKTGTTENEFRYVGEQWDPNIGWYYNRARWLNPAIGRFTSVDPFEGCIECGFSLHRYLYANVNPINNVDPSGEVNTIQSTNATVVGFGILRVSANVFARVVVKQGRKITTHLMCGATVAAAKLAEATADLHHVASNKHKSKWTQKYDKIFDLAGMTLGEWANLLYVPGHGGRHSTPYHQAVYDDLLKAVTGKTGDQAAKALEKKLKEIAESICGKKGKFYKLLMRIP